MKRLNAHIIGYFVGVTVAALIVAASVQAQTAAEVLAAYNSGVRDAFVPEIGSPTVCK